MEAVRQFGTSLWPRSACAATLSGNKPCSSSSSSTLPHFGVCNNQANNKVVRCASKKSGASSTKGRAASTAGGFGVKTAVKPSFDAGVLLKRSEQLYSRLIADHATEGELREFVICVREKKTTTKAVLDDWLPVAELALVSEQDASVMLPVLLPTLCREVAECAAKGAVALRSISRSGLEYAYEPAEGFYDYVMAGSNLKLTSTECPYSVLGLLKGAPASEVRAAYRSLAAKNHPDKQFGADPSSAEDEFKRVTNAYDQIKRAGLASEGELSYASLGGTARNGLSEPIIMNSSNMSSGVPEGVKVAVRQLDPDIVSRFLTRLYARSGGASAV